VRAGRHALDPFRDARRARQRNIRGAHALPNPPFAPLGGAYAFAFDDNCNQTWLIGDLSNPSAISITIDPF